MPQLPKGAIKLNLASHISIRKNAGRRIITQTGYQYEVTAEEIELICPICNHPQPAPTAQGVDYQCPKCRWYYKVYGDMLCCFSPSSIGVSIVALAPGERPEQVIFDGPSSEPDKLDRVYQESIDDWKKRKGNNEEEAWGRKTQVIMADAIKGAKK